MREGKERRVREGEDERRERRGKREEKIRQRKFRQSFLTSNSNCRLYYTIYLVPTCSHAP